MRLRSLSFSLTLVALLIVLTGAMPATAATIGGAHCIVALGEYIPATPDPFFLGIEGTPTQFSIVEVDQPDCYATPQATYRAEDGTATNFTDFDLPEGQAPVEGQVEVTIPITDDPPTLTESSVEDAIVVLEANATVARPSSVPLYIVDVDGADRVTLLRSAVSRAEDNAHIKIPVFRAGPATGPIVIDYAITPGSATPGDDYQGPAGGTLAFGAGARLKFIEFDIIEDSAPPLEPAQETIQISITPPAGVEAETPTSMTFTILDDDQDTIAPVTRWHHPRQGLTYSPGDYRIREVHVFGKDEGLSGLVAVDMALRKKFKDGHCAWWTPGSGFVRGPCSAKVWVPMEDGGPGLENWPYFYVRDIPRLRPSVGTKIKFYTAWCRAKDGAGNPETTFDRGRNLSAFEVEA